MNKKDLILNILLFISQIIVFYYFFCYLFPFKEQLQMFQFTSQYLTETLKQAGGVATVSYTHLTLPTTERV